MRELAGILNGILWSTPLPVLCLAAGAIFTVALRGVQIRKIKTMVNLLFNGQSSDRGLSSFQAFTLAIAGRVGTGNIAGVATAIFTGGPGAVFWMWVVALFGSATSFIECTMSQLYKEEIGGEYRGGCAYYMKKGLPNKTLGKWIGGAFAIIFIIAEAACLTGIQANAISSAMGNAFSIPNVACGIVVVALLGYIIFGGSKRLGRAAEMIVPFMAIIYCIVGVIILIVNAAKIPETLVLIVTSAFGADALFGGILGTAVMMGVKRGIYSNESGMGTATPSAASAEVSHPVKQGLVQSFSVYIDTLFVCTATALMMLVTGCYNVDGGLITNMGAVEAGPMWVQAAVSTLLPFGSQFVAIALFFFAFTTLMSMYYNCETSLAFFFDGKTVPKSAIMVLRVAYLAFTFSGAVISSGAAWDFGDVGIGMITWVNVICLFFFVKTAVALLKDFEEQKRQGLDPVFDPDQFNLPGTELWKSVKKGYDEGKLKN